METNNNKEKESIDCHKCGSQMKRDLRLVKCNYKDHTTWIKQPGWYCNSCEEAIYTGFDVEDTEPEYQQFKKMVDKGYFSNQKLKQSI